MQSIWKFLGPSAALAVLLCVAVPASAQTAPDLGDAQDFAVLGGSTVTNTGGTVITGRLGVSPGSSVTGFPPGVVVNGTINLADALAAAAQTSVTAAYIDLEGQVCPGGNDLTGTDLGGLTLTEGVYCFDSSAQLTGTLTLDAQGDPTAVFIFQIGSTLTTASGSSVELINGASECNVFWQVGSSATLGTTTDFMGSILALTSITLNTGAGVAGRTLARNGAVTLDTNTVNVETCASGSFPPPCPAITVSPETLPNGTVGVAYSETITASGGTEPYTFTVSSGGLPEGLTLTPEGEISGTPTAAGDFTFTVLVTDANGCFGSTTYTQSILADVPPPGCPVVTLSPETLPDGRVGVAYSQTITASGGTEPYTFTVSSGDLPEGLTLTPEGVLSGTPTAGGDFTYTIRGTDVDGCFGEVSFTLSVLNGVPTLPQVFVLLLALGLTAAGYFSLRQARAA